MRGYSGFAVGCDLHSEFQSYDTAYCDPQQQPMQIEAKLRKLPKGARVTHRRLISGDGFRGSYSFQQMDGSSGQNGFSGV